MGHLLKESEMQDVKGLKVVRVSKGQLLEKIRACRAQHVRDHAEALMGYQLKVVSELAAALKEAKDGMRYKVVFALPVPESRVKDYDRVIAMLEMSLDDTLELPASEFARYVLDEWEWSNAFQHTKALYAQGER